MRVGIDAHMIGQRETGNETYVLGLLAGLDSIDFPADVYGFGPIETQHHRVHRIWPRQSAVRIPLSYPCLALRDHLDVFHATYVLPPILPCASVVAIHDITYLLHPEWFDPSVQRMLAVLVPFSIKRASHVITISENSRNDIMERYGVPPDRISVTHLAPRPQLTLPASPRPPAEPFFLYVGNVQPRKNFGTILRALALLRQRGVEAKVVVAGKLDRSSEPVRQLMESLSIADVVDFRGYVSDAELRDLYASCTALLHPALYEGFGLTPLEAMAQGAPVVAANTSAIPEVVGDAGILLAPQDIEAWADAMERMLSDEPARAALVSKGRARVGQFSWEECARRTVAVYQCVSS